MFDKYHFTKLDCIICQIECFANSSNINWKMSGYSAPGPAKEAPALLVAWESICEISFSKLSTGFTPSYCFCCGWVFIKVLFTCACHLSKIWTWVTGIYSPLFILNFQVTLSFICPWEREVERGRRAPPALSSNNTCRSLINCQS